jgi:hypothetical protein
VEGKMVEKRILSIEVFEVETPDGSDHRIEVMGNHAGLELKYQATIDEIRRFFTEERSSRKKSRQRKTTRPEAEPTN